MCNKIISNILQISTAENEILTASFKEEEVFEAISQMEHNKAPRPDRFPAEFYNFFWSVIKDDLMAMFCTIATRRVAIV
jgi:hypothetical protein